MKVNLSKFDYALYAFQKKRKTFSKTSTDLACSEISETSYFDFALPAFQKSVSQKKPELTKVRVLNND